MPLIPFFLVGLGLVLLVLAYRLWHKNQPTGSRCGDCSKFRGVEVYVLRTGPHYRAEMLLCPSCADRRRQMAQSLTRKVPVHIS